MKIVFRDAHDALFLIRKKTKIKKERKIYLAGDQTPMQLAQLKSLKEELTIHTENSEKTWH